MFYRWLFLAILILAVGLRLTNLAYEPLWLDEIYSLMVANVHVNPVALPSMPLSAQQWVDQYTAWQPMDWSALIAMLKLNVHMPLYYLLLNPWLGWLGTGEWALRSFSVVWSVAMLLPLAWFGRALGGKRLALGVLILATCCPFQLNFAQEGRMYTLTLFWTVLSGLALWKLCVQQSTTRHPNRWGVAYAVAAIAGMFSHYIFAFQVAFHGLVWAVAWWRQRQMPQLRNAMLANRWILATWGLLAGLIWQWLPIYWAQKAMAIDSDHFSAGLLSADRYLQAFIMEPLTLVAGNNVLAKAIIFPLASVGLLLAGWALVAAVRQQAKAPQSKTTCLGVRGWLFLWGWMWLPLALQTVVDVLQQTHTVTIERYSLLIAPAVYLLITQGALFGLAQLGRRFVTTTVVLQVGLTILWLMLGFGAVWQPSVLRDKPNYPFHQIVQGLAPALQPGDVVLVNGPIGAPPSLAYYLAQYRPHQPIIYWAADYPTQLNAPRPQAILKKQYQRVWLFGYRGNRRRGYYRLLFETLQPRYLCNTTFPKKSPLASLRLYSDCN